MKAVAITVLLLVIISAAGSVGAQADPYGVLRSEGEGYAQVVPGRRFDFPVDHLPHPDYRIEWWYITANLTDVAGRLWGAQWTLFRSATRPSANTGGWDSGQVWMAHAAITTPAGHRYEQRYARGGIGQADVRLTDGKFSGWLDDWSFTGEGAEMFPSHLHFTVGDTRIDLRLNAEQPFVLQGNGGYSQKSEQGQASYYYSQPNIGINGRITVDGVATEVTGTGWLDREWSSQPLAENQQGWDWFSLHLADGHALMLYRLRHDDGKHWLSGSWISPDGSSRTLRANEIELVATEYRKVRTPTAVDDDATRELPLAWRIRLPELDRQWTVRALIDDQWLGGMFPYWEGVVLIDAGESGVGFMELTGYAPAKP